MASASKTCASKRSLCWIERRKWGADNVTLILVVWFGAAVLSAAWVAYDLVTSQPEIMRVMKAAWTLITLYLGVMGAVLYVVPCRPPAPAQHEQFVAPMWKQAVRSTIHCVAGDALEIALVAAITALTRLSVFADFGLEYSAAFLFGWLIFQVVPVVALQGRSLRQALKTAFRAELVSLTAMVVGMFPAMYCLMTRAAGGGPLPVTEPTRLQFSAIMAAAIAIGFLTAYPVNWWMVRMGWKHGVGTAHVIGKGGHRMAVEVTG